MGGKEVKTQLKSHRSCESHVADVASLAKTDEATAERGERGNGTMSYNRAVGMKKGQRAEDEGVRDTHVYKKTSRTTSRPARPRSIGRHR